jgi:signal peptidase I
VKRLPTVLGVTLLALWLAFLRPPFLGGSTSYVIVAGTSMEPAFHTGDLAVVREQTTYRRGDVVAFLAGGALVIHRIVGGNGDEGFRVRGDNRDEADLWRPTAEQIVGRAWFHVPNAGRLLIVLSRPLNLALLLAVVTFFAVVGAGRERPRAGPRPSARLGAGGGAALALLATPASAAAALLLIHAATLSVFQYPVAIRPLAASVDVKPESLGKRSSGEPVLAFVELPVGSDLRDVDIRSVRLCRGADPCGDGVPVAGKPKIGDADGDGVDDLKLSFERAAVLALVRDVRPPADVVFTVSGLVGDAAFFAGSDTVRVVERDTEPGSP